ncbi:Ig-like domain-containing protein [Brevibacillus sp. SYSU BS000544]|uniref:RCC1 domain-containing protein n=1 Tax=Brevibacillus sp. SYSU BS000544 TaxID=3416443 RepID=UPI003CE4C05F
MSRFAKWLLSLTVASSALPWNVASASAGSPEDYPIVKSGFDFNVAVKEDGTVWAWGRNTEGELGDGSTTSVILPKKIRDLKGITDLAAGYTYALALDEEQHVWAWGSNESGQLGDGTTVAKRTPVEVKGLKDVVDVAAGRYHSAALDEDGNLWSWGDNTYGQLGDGTNSGQSAPAKIKGLSKVTALSVGTFHSAAVLDDGSVFTWGFNGEGILGIGDGPNSPSPVEVLGLTSVVDVAAGWRHTLALRSNGTVYSWGRNGEGQLGDGTNVTKDRPVKVEGLSDVVAIAAGHDASYAVKKDGSLWAWGSNYSSHLGDGTSDKRLTPVQVVGPNQSGVLKDVISVSAGESHAMAVDEEGNVFGWGSNNGGQLGYDSAQASPSPVKINHNFVIDSKLTGLKLSDGTLSPNFSRKIKKYTAQVANQVESITVTPTAFNSNAGILISMNGAKEAIVSGQTTNPLPLSVGENQMEIVVKTLDSATTYHVTVTRSSENQAPVASDLSLSTQQETEVKGTLPAKDEEGDTLTYSIVDNGSHGTAKLTDAEKGAFTYTPDKDFIGTDSFTFKANDGKHDSNIATVSVTVGKQGSSDLLVSEENLLLQPSKTTRLKVYMVDEKGKKKDISTDNQTKYVTSDKNIVTVGKGIVKAGKQEGEATITISYKELNTEVTVKVAKNSVSKLTSSQKKVTLKAGETSQVSLKAVFSDKSEADVTALATWTSSKPEIATVVDGQITALKTGTATIKAIYGGKSVNVTVSVKKK